MTKEIEQNFSIDQKDTEQCQNPKCKRFKPNLHLVYLNGQEQSLCDYCADAVFKNWVCPYCKEIFMESETTNDTDWVGCDNESCTRWTHIECEAQKGDPNIKNRIKNLTYQYKCPSCRNKNCKTIQKKSLKKSSKIATSQELKKIMIPKKNKKSLSNNYYYLYSDAYKTIEKLLNSNTNNSLKLTMDELNQDLEKINSITGKKVFNITPIVGKRRQKQIIMDDD